MTTIPRARGYFDPTFPERMRKLIKKLGEAWDNDPRVAYVEMGLIWRMGRASRSGYIYCISAALPA